MTVGLLEGNAHLAPWNDSQRDLPENTGQGQGWFLSLWRKGKCPFRGAWAANGRVFCCGSALRDPREAVLQKGGSAHDDTAKQRPGGGAVPASRRG